MLKVISNRIGLKEEIDSWYKSNKQEERDKGTKTERQNPIISEIYNWFKLANREMVDFLIYMIYQNSLKMIFVI